MATYTPEQEAAARALLAKGDALGTAASQQTGVAYQPAYTSAPYTTSSGQQTYNNPAAPVSYTPSPSVSAPAQTTTGKTAPTSFNGYNFEGMYGDQYLYNGPGGYYLINGNWNGDPSTFQSAINMSQFNNSEILDTAHKNPTPKQLAGSVQSAPQAQTTTQNASQTQAGTQTGTQTNPQQTGQQAQQAAQAGMLTMPANGSVVDLLNSAGVNSSYANRAQLAAQYGISGYTGTAAQNTTLAKKFMDAYNATKNSAAPASAGEARAAIQSLTSNDTTPNPQQAFYDAYASMNPVEASVYDSINQILSSINTRTSLTDEYNQLVSSTGVQGLETQLMDLNRVMEGTEDDIRSEISAAGGFATESQVQAMTTARNKTLLKQANALSDQIQIKNDYIKQVMDLTQADRAQVDKDLNTKLGLAQTLYTMQQNMNNAAKDNYKMIISSIGWDGLARELQGNPSQQAQVEKMFGLSPGELTSLGMQAQLQRSEDVSTSIVDVGGNKVLVNSKTGDTIKVLGSSSSGSGANFTTTQINTGAARAGVSTQDFKALPANVQNLFVSDADTADLIVSDISDFKDGTKSLQDAIDDINSQRVPQDVKDYFLALLPSSDTSGGNSGGGFWHSIASFFSF